MPPVLTLAAIPIMLSLPVITHTLGIDSSGKMKIWEKQGWHAAALVVSLPMLGWLLSIGAVDGQFLGVSTPTWYWLAVAVPIVHQLFVWLVWRMQLHYGLPTRWLGGLAFPLYGAIFMVLLAGRALLLITLAVADQGTLLAPAQLRGALALFLLLPSLYLSYSVARYFGIRRAMGLDHFDPAYARKPFVRQGIFRYVNNAMYTTGFLALYLPGLLLDSRLAVVVAFFNHLYIWVHYYCTEQPDMRHIYGAERLAAAGRQ